MTFVVIAISCLSFCLTCMPCVCVSECLVVRTQKALLLLCCSANSCGIDFSFSHFLCLMFNTKETVAAFWMFSSYEFLSCVNKYTCFMRLFSPWYLIFFFFHFWKKEKMRAVTEGELLEKAQILWRVVLQVREMLGAASSGRKPSHGRLHQLLPHPPPGDLFCLQGWLSSAVLGIKLDSGFWTRLVCLPL